MIPLALGSHLGSREVTLERAREPEGAFADRDRPDLNQVLQAQTAWAS